MTRPLATVLPGGHSEWEPPDPFSNSEVNTLCADASVDFVDVKVGHCQALNSMQTGKPPTGNRRGFFFICPQQQTIVQPRQLLDRSRALVHCMASKRRFVSGTLRFVSVYARLRAAHRGTICTDGSSPRTSSLSKKSALAGADCGGECAAAHLLAHWHSQTQRLRSRELPAARAHLYR